MSIVYPDGTPTLGNTRVAAALAIASMAAPKVATEIKAVTSVDGSCYLYPAGWTPTATTSKGEKPARLCSKRTLQQFNRTAYDLGDLQYVYNPQAIDSATGNELKNILQPGTIIYLVERIGLDAETVDWAAGQQVVTHKVRVGPQVNSGDRTDENGEFFITQSVIYVNDGPVPGVLAA